NAFRHFDMHEGSPDGMTLDASGRLWIAFWGESCVRVLDPENAEIVQVIEFPVPYPTSCAFGGSDGTTLFVTSAAVARNKAELAEYPLSGSLFAIGMRGTKGDRPHRVRL